MIRIETRSIDSFLEAMKKYPPELVTLQVGHRCGRYARNENLIEASLLYRGAKALLDPKDWIQVLYTFNPPLQDCYNQNEYILSIGASNKLAAVKILRGLNVPEAELEKLKAIKVKKIKEMVDDSDDEIDFLSAKTSSTGTKMDFTSGELLITLKASKDADDFLTIFIDFSKLVDNVREKIKAAMAPDVLFLDDTGMVSIAKGCDR